MNLNEVSEIVQPDELREIVQPDELLEIKLIEDIYECHIYFMKEELIINYNNEIFNNSVRLSLMSILVINNLIQRIKIDINDLIKLEDCIKLRTIRMSEINKLFEKILKTKSYLSIDNLRNKCLITERKDLKQAMCTYFETVHNWLRMELYDIIESIQFILITANDEYVSIPDKLRYYNQFIY